MQGDIFCLQGSELIRIFLYLPQDELFKISQICSRFQILTKNSPLNAGCYRLKNTCLKIINSSFEAQKLSHSFINPQFSVQKFIVYNSFEKTCDILSKATEVITDLYSMPNTTSFKELPGGMVNPPIAALSIKDEKQQYLGVFKAVKDNLKVAHLQLKIIESMQSNGFKHFPVIFKNKYNELLTKIESVFFYYISFLEPDNAKISFEQFLLITGHLHEKAKKNLHHNELLSPKLNEYQLRSHVFVDSCFENYDPIFKDLIWQEIVSLSQIFLTEGFKYIYENLPRQLIHGDNNQTNIIMSNEIPYFIDFDSLRIDARLLDIASYFRYGGFDNYIQLTRSGELFNYVNSTYGKNTSHLTNVEKIYFHWIVAFSHIEFVSWALVKLKKAILSTDKEKAKEFSSYIKVYIDQLREILKILKHP